MAARLIAICGPMFSGKSSELVRRLRAASGEGLAVAAAKPVLDDRYAQREIVTHAGERVPAHAVHDAGEIQGAVGLASVVGIDEAHFFGSPLTGSCRELLDRGVTVLVAGLERDHRGCPFEPFPALLCEADEVLKLSCPCSVCGGEAVHSQRMVPGEGRIVVGGAGAYEPRCRRCFGK